MRTSAATSRPATRWSRTVAAVTAALVLTPACTTAGGRAQNATSRQASATIAAGHDAATRDKATLARYVHRLLAGKLGLNRINLVGHDLGAGVAFQYATQFPSEVVRYAHLDYPMPGPALSANAYRQASWHMSFHHQDGFPELLVDDDVRDYLSLFYGYVAYGGTSFGGPGAKAPSPARRSSPSCPPSPALPRCPGPGTG
ncbi:alpha/beta fold hydrolase [Micromonospora matsumotoense]|uniref:alpha/beta fold hydrolase n=1 Tax=Micromonospora matsumotoense TaxID=121616 RepID=UPI0033C9213C